jgi:hypothetical protein
MIGLNRQAEFAQEEAGHDFNEEERELHVNTDLTTQIHRLSTEMHAHLTSVGWTLDSKVVDENPPELG